MVLVSQIYLGSHVKLVTVAIQCRLRSFTSVMCKKNFDLINSLAKSLSVLVKCQNTWNIKFMHFARFPFDDRMFFKIKWFIEFM